MKRTIKRNIGRCDEGATVVEFALLAPILFTIVLGIIEFSLVLSASMIIESATNVSSRMGKTGYTVNGQSRQDMIYQMVRDKSVGLLNPANIVITSFSYSNLSNVGQPEAFTDTNHNGRYDVGETYTDINGNGQWDPDMGIAGLGGANDIVVYRVSYSWSIQTPIFREIIGPNFAISSSVIVKNEPYDD